MNFQSHSPDQRIAPCIESIFHYKGLAPDHSIERVVPTGHVFILFELDGFVRRTYDSDTLQPNAEYTKAWISGMHRGHISISAHQNSEMMVIQFKPFGSFPFTHIETEQLNERIVPAQDILGESLPQLRDEAVKTSTSQEKFELLERWLLSRFDESRLPPPELVDFVERLQKEPVARLADLVKSYPGSQKKLINQFRKFVGLTPKSFQRIVRFNDVLAEINNQQEVSWSDAAYSCGYSDQPHFIREFQAFSGMNPSEFLRQDHNQQEPNFFPLD